MSEARITALLDEAAERYNKGDYEQAVRLWGEVLELDPSAQKAREGIRMAGLLMSEQRGAGRPPQPSHEAQDPSNAPAVSEEKILAGLARIRELMAAGEMEQALEGCAILSGIAPEHEEVRALADELGRSAASASTGIPEGDIDGLLAGARRALEEGRNKEAAEAASKALQIDPSSMEACGILSLAADDDTAAIPLDTGGEPAATPRAEEHADGAVFEAIPLEDPDDTAPVAGASDDASRVARLIAEGQAAFDAGRPQEAVEIWSRVFAIDQTNLEATELMDRAKAALAEQTREVDDMFFRAVDAYDADRLEEALGLFQNLVAISPLHAEAASYIDQIQARLDGPGDTIKLSIPLETGEAADKSAQEQDIFDGASLALALDHDEPGRPAARPEAPEPRESRPAARRHPAPAPRGGFRRVLVAAAGATLFVGVAVGAYLWFGTGTASMPEAQATAPAPHVVRPGPPQPAQPASSGEPLQVLPGAKRQTPPPEAPLPRVEDLKQQAAALERDGLQYYARKQWPEAVLALRKAAELDPLDFRSTDELDEAMSQLERQARLEEERDLATRYFREQDYASALHKLYRLQLDYPEIREFDVLIRNCWYNWGVILLQAGAVDEAEEKFGEALGISPRDKDAMRGHEIAQRYHGRTRDVAFDAFAASLSLRPFDQR